MHFREYLIARGLATRTVQTYSRYVARAREWAESQGLDLLRLSASETRALGDTFPKTHASRRPLRVALRHYWAFHGVEGPEEAIIVPKRPRGIYRGLDDADVRTLLAFARADWPRGAAVYVGMYQGLRRETIARLQWDDFSEDLTWLDVLVKGDYTHSMPVHPAVRAALDPHRWPGEYVFPGRFGGHVSTATINNWISAICHEAGLGHVTPHQMRHTAGGKVYRMTGDIRLAASWLGHAHISTTQIYTRVVDDQLVDAVEVFDWEDPDDDVADAA